MTLAQVFYALIHTPCMVWSSFPDPVSHTGRVYYGGSCLEAWRISWQTLLPWQVLP